MISSSLPFLSSIRFLFLFFFSFFFLLHFVNHTRIPILVHPLLFLFLYFHFPEAPSFFLLLFFFTSTWFQKLSDSLIFFSHFFFFLLDSINSLALSVILDSIILLAFLVSLSSKFKHTQTRMERGEIVFAPPHRHRCYSSSLRSACNQGSYRLFFFFSWSFIVVLIFFFLFLICCCCCFDFRFVV